MAPFNDIRHMLRRESLMGHAIAVALRCDAVLEQYLTDPASEALAVLWLRLNQAGVGTRGIAQIWHVRIATVQRCIRDAAAKATEETERRRAGRTHTIMVDGYPCDVEEVEHAS